MTTSTRAVPLLVPDTDVRYPSDVFTGDGRRTLTYERWVELHEGAYGERAAGQRAGLQNRLSEGSTPSSPAINGRRER